MTDEDDRYSRAVETRVLRRAAQVIAAFEEVLAGRDAAVLEDDELDELLDDVYSATRAQGHGKGAPAHAVLSALRRKAHQYESAAAAVERLMQTWWDESAAREAERAARKAAATRKAPKGHVVPFVRPLPEPEPPTP